MPDFWTKSQIDAIGGPTGGHCEKCGWCIDDHDGLMEDEPKCRSPKKPLPRTG